MLLQVTERLLEVPYSRNNDNNVLFADDKGSPVPDEETLNSVDERIYSEDQVLDSND